MVRTQEDLAQQPLNFFDFYTTKIKKIKRENLNKILSTYKTKPSSWPKVINYNPLKVFYVNDNSLVFFDPDYKISHQEKISTKDGYAVGYIGHNEEVITVHSYESPKIQTYSFVDMKKKEYEFNPKAFTVPYHGVVLNRLNTLVFSQLDETGLFMYDFGSRKLKEIDTGIKHIINRPFIESITTDIENRCIFFAVRKGGGRLPSKWIGLFVYDVEKNKIVYKDKIETHGNTIKEISLTPLSNKVIGLSYANLHKQLDWYVKYKY
jgi:hypothetical protein